VRTLGVVDSFPLSEFLIAFGHSFGFFFEQEIELVVGIVALFEEGVFLWAMGAGEEVGAGVGAGLVKGAEELGAVVGVEVLDGEGESELGFMEEAVEAARRTRRRVQVSRAVNR
jgi:hypothetical protein